MNTDGPENQAITPTDADLVVGLNIRLCRLQKNLSQADLAKRIVASVEELQAIEEGRMHTDTAVLGRLAKALKVDVNALLKGYGPPRELSQGLARDVDIWFSETVYPNERDFLWVARTLTPDRDSARDLVHDAYAQVLVDERWRSVESAKAYLIQTVINLGRKLIRRDNIVHIRPMIAAEAYSYIDVSPDAFQTVASRERLQRVLAAIDELPAQQQRVFRMRRIQDLPLKEIAKRLGISLPSAQTHLARATTALMEKLSNEDPMWVSSKTSLETQSKTRN